MRIVCTRAARERTVDSAEANDSVAEIKPQYRMARWIKFHPCTKIEREVHCIERTSVDKRGYCRSLVEVNKAWSDFEKDSRILNSSGHLHTEECLGPTASFEQISRKKIHFAFDPSNDD
jgi:hypothetical protein